MVSLFLASGASAQDLTAADLTLAGMQLGRNTLQDVLTRFGLAPLRNGDVDELCYRSESPLQAAWVLFGSGHEGDGSRQGSGRGCGSRNKAAASPRTKSGCTRRANRASRRARICRSVRIWPPASAQAAP